MPIDWQEFAKDISARAKIASKAITDMLPYMEQCNLIDIDSSNDTVALFDEERPHIVDHHEFEDSSSIRIVLDKRKWPARHPSGEDAENGFLTLLENIDRYARENLSDGSDNLMPSYVGYDLIGEENHSIIYLDFTGEHHRSAALELYTQLQSAIETQKGTPSR